MSISRSPKMNYLRNDRGRECLRAGALAAARNVPVPTASAVPSDESAALRRWAGLLVLGAGGEVGGRGSWIVTQLVEGLSLAASMPIFANNC